MCAREGYREGSPALAARPTCGAVLAGDSIPLRTQRPRCPRDYAQPSAGKLRLGTATLSTSKVRRFHSLAVYGRDVSRPLATVFRRRCSLRGAYHPHGGKDRRHLRQRFCDQFPAYVGETKIPAQVSIGEPCVIESEQMQNRGLQIVDVGLILHDIQTEFVGCPNGLAALDTGSGHPNTVKRTGGGRGLRRLSRGC